MASCRTRCNPVRRTIAGGRRVRPRAAVALPMVHGAALVFCDCPPPLPHTACPSLGGSRHVVSDSAIAPLPCRADTIVIHIGTNNLGVGMTPASTADGIVAVAKHVHKVRPNALVEVMGVLPRGIHKESADTTQFRALVADVNSRVERAVRALGDGTTTNNSGGSYAGGPTAGTTGTGRVTYVDCSAGFVGAESGAVDAALMPDFLHPSALGMEKIGRCLQHQTPTR
jgi:lysophospholipase L1-like esterase